MKAQSKKYVDGYIIPLKKKDIPAYRKTALWGAKVWKKYGALDYYECIGDDLDAGYGMGFKKLAKLKDDETLVFSFIVYKSKAHRNEVNKKVMKDPAMHSFDPQSVPVDMKRFVSGGFKTIIEG